MEETIYNKYKRHRYNSKYRQSLRTSHYDYMVRKAVKEDKLALLSYITPPCIIETLIDAMKTSYKEIKNCHRTMITDVNDYHIVIVKALGYTDGKGKINEDFVKAVVFSDSLNITKHDSNEYTEIFDLFTYSVISDSSFLNTQYDMAVAKYYTNKIKKKLKKSNVYIGKENYYFTVLLLLLIRDYYELTGLTTITGFYEVTPLYFSILWDRFFIWSLNLIKRQEIDVSSYLKRNLVHSKSITKPINIADMDGAEKLRDVLYIREGKYLDDCSLYLDSGLFQAHYLHFLKTNGKRTSISSLANRGERGTYQGPITR